MLIRHIRHLNLEFDQRETYLIFQLSLIEIHKLYTQLRPSVDIIGINNLEVLY